MGPRSTAVLCTRVGSWAEAGLKKAATASSVGGFRAGAALGIEPVTSSVAGACLPPLVTFRSPKTPNTRMANPTTPSRVRWLRVSLNMANRCRTIEHPNPRRASVLLREWEFYSAGANSFLEPGSFVRARCGPRVLSLAASIARRHRQRRLKLPGAGANEDVQMYDIGCRAAGRRRPAHCGACPRRRTLDHRHPNAFLPHGDRGGRGERENLRGGRLPRRART